MTTDETQPNANDTVIEELTAYLDGELDEATQLAVENRLGEDPEYLQELHSLQRTWDTLDHLPMVDAGKSFTQTTMELIVDQAKSEKRSRKISWSLVFVPLLLFLLGGGLFAAGYAFQRSNKDRPDQVLLDHLPVIQRHEVYDSINHDLAFLEQLNHRDLFPQLSYDPIKSFEQVTQPEEVTSSNDSREDRLAFVGSLDVEQKAALKEKLNDFLALAPEKQTALIDFQKQLYEHPDHDQLVFVLNEYYHWLKSLDAGERSRLQDKATGSKNEALALIQEMRVQARENDARNNFLKISSSLPNQEDSEVIFNWYLQLISSKEELIRDRFPVAFNAYRERKGVSKLPEAQVRRRFDRREVSLIASFLMNYDREFVDDTLVTDQESDLLVAMLTSESRDLLFSMPEQYQRDAILSWIATVNDAYRKSFRVSESQLRKFASSLDESQQDQLKQLPAQDYVPKLMEMYRKHNSSLPNDPSERRFQRPAGQRGR